MRQEQTLLRISKKKFEGEDLPHELFVTTRQTTKIMHLLLLTICQQI